MITLKNFTQWVNEAAEPVQNTGGALNQEVRFSFNFDSGKYLESEIPADQLEKLKTDLKPIVTELSIPKYLNGQTNIELTASTSTLRLMPEFIQKLTAAGYKGLTGQADPSGNDLLASARLMTVETLITKLLAEMLKTTPQALKTKVTFTKISKPNQGGGATPEEQKVWQYISMKVTQTGTPIPEAVKVPCGIKDRLYNGKMGISTNNYVGYAADLILTIPATNTITISFNALDIPDMFYIKYRDIEFLSQFQGSARHAPNLAKIVDLEQKINAELQRAGSTKTLRELQPNAIAQDGTWIVAKGQYQNAATGIYSVTVMKSWENDDFKIRVFSPLAATRFTISTMCQAANADQLLAKQS